MGSLAMAAAAAALMLGVSLGSAALVRRANDRADAKPVASANVPSADVPAPPVVIPPQPKPVPPKPKPGGGNPPAKPPAGRPPWKARPDPAVPPLPPRAVAAGPGFPVNGTPLFASGDGLFVIDTPERGLNFNTKLHAKEPPWVPVFDLGAGKPAGAMAKAAPRGRLSLLSPDGGLLATQGTAGPGEPLPVAIWAPRGPAARTQLRMPGSVLWMEFLTSGELLVLCRDRAGYRLQKWNVALGRAVNDWPLSPTLFPPARPDVIVFNPDRQAGAVSPGRHYAALGTPSGIVLLSLADGQPVGLLSLREGEERPDYRGMRFAADGTALTAVIGFRRRGGGGGVCLRAWKMADGSPALDVALANLNLAGPPLPGPRPDTVFLTGQRRDRDKSFSVGVVVDTRTGATVLETPYTPVLWLADGRLLAVGPIKNAPPGTPLPTGLDRPKPSGNAARDRLALENWEKRQRDDPAVRAVYPVKVDGARAGVAPR